MHVRVHCAKRLPKAWSEDSKGRPCDFFITVHVDHKDEVLLRTASAQASKAEHDLWRVDWAAAGEGTVEERSFAEITSDLVLKLHRVEPSRPNSAEVKAELCLPLSALPDMADGVPPAHWHELLLPRDRNNGLLHSTGVVPPFGQPGWLMLSAGVTLCTPKVNSGLRAAALLGWMRVPAPLAAAERLYLAKYCPNPSRDLWSGEPHEAQHPNIGGLLTGAITNGHFQNAWFRIDQAVKRVLLGCTLAPLRTACYLQTWRRPILNLRVAVVIFVATEPVA